jgi:hypothetical protein
VPESTGHQQSQQMQPQLSYQQLPGDQCDVLVQHDPPQPPTEGQAFE